MQLFYPTSTVTLIASAFRLAATLILTHGMPVCHIPAKFSILKVLPFGLPATAISGANFGALSDETWECSNTQDFSDHIRKTEYSGMIFGDPGHACT